MKKNIFLIPIIGMVISCSNETKTTEELPEKLQKQTEAIENSIQKLEETIQDSNIEMEKTQSEIDTLLDNI